MTMNKQWKNKQLPMVKKHWGLLWALVTLVSICQMPGATAAECTSPMQGRVNIAPPSSLNISPSVTVGSVIGTTSVSWPATPAPCTMTGIGSVMGVGTPSGNVYPTTISGIGYRAKATVTNWPDVLQTYWPTAQHVSATYGLTGYFVAGSLKIEFIKTGPISSQGGTFGPGKLGSVYVYGKYATGDFVMYYLSSAMTVKPTAPACTVTSSAISVPLPDTSQTALGTAGSTSASTAFNLPLNCSAATSLSLSFSGDMADSANGVFKNTNTGNAANVGIQILKDGTPVPTATDSYVNIGSVNGSLNVPLTARYYALTAGVPAGAVNSTAYASIVYN